MSSKTSKAPVFFINKMHGLVVEGAQTTTTKTFKLCSYLTASQMLQRKHMAAIETRINFVLPDYESILGDHAFVATTLSWIGSSYQALRHYDNAIKFNKRALEIRERLLGRHQETARSLFDLGTSLTAKMEYKR